MPCQLALLYPVVEHAADGIGIGPEVERNIRQRRLAAFHHVVLDVRQYHDPALAIAAIRVSCLPQIRSPATTMAMSAVMLTTHAIEKTGCWL